MAFSIKIGTDDIDWVALRDIFRLTPLGIRDADGLRTAAENSYLVCSAFAGQKLIGFGRALSDGLYQSAIYDLVVLPRFQNRGVGRAIMQTLLGKLPRSSTVLIYAAPGKQQFYRQLGFDALKTGMGRFPRPELARAKGYLS